MLKVTLHDGTVIVGNMGNLDGSSFNVSNPHNWGGMVSIPTNQVKYLEGTETWTSDPRADIPAI